MVEKMLPALIYKNEDDDYEIEIFSFNREILVRNMSMPLKADCVNRVIYQQIIKPFEDITADRPVFISSIDIKPKFRITNYSSEVKFLQQPTNKKVFVNSVEISRHFETTKNPFVILTEAEENPHPENKEPIVWNSSVSFDLFSEV